MTASSAADYPTLGFDPAPGDTTEVSSLVSTLSGVSTALNEISNVLHGSADGEWRGDAARAFRDLLDDDLRPKVDKACDAFGDAHRHMSSWDTHLTSYQSRARELERKAAEAQGRADHAQSALASLPPAPGPGAEPPEGDAARQRLADQADQRSSNRSALTSAASEANGYRDDARTLHGSYESTGGDIARLLAHSIDIAPEEPGWLDSVVGSLGDFFDSIGDLIADLGDIVVDFLHSIAPLLKLIGDIAGLLSTVLGLLAFIPGLQFLAIPALVLGGVALLAHYGSAVGESGSFLSALTDPAVIMDAVGMALGVGALKLGGRLVQAARVSGNTRMVPQLVGPAQEVPYGFFSIAKGLVTSMDTPEFVVRTVGLKLTWAGFGLTGAGAKGTAGTLGKVFSWDFGPLTNEPVVQ